MSKKKFAEGQEHGFIGESRYKTKPKPFTESPIITNYMALRDSFDWTLEPGPPKYEKPEISLNDIFKEQELNNDGKLYFPDAKIKIETEQEQKDKKQSSEFVLQTKICKWINETWPGLIFVSDFAAGLFLPPHIASARAQQACMNKYPDLTILSPRGGYFGLFVEIKTEKGTVYLKDGKTLKSSDHIAAQNITLEKLKAIGYVAVFGVGEDQIKRIIMKYMGFEQTKKLP